MVSWRRGTLGALVVSLVAAGASPAQVPPGGAAPMSDVQWSLAQRLDALESEVARLRGQQHVDPPPAECCSVAPDRSEWRSGRFYGGYAFFFAKPHFKEAFQATVIDTSGTLHMVPFSYDYDLTPRVWFGLNADNGLGIRTRYWQYDHAADPFRSQPTDAMAMAQVVETIFPASIVAIPAIETLVVRDELETQTLDLEATQGIDFGKFSAVASGGVRYVMLRQSMFASVAGGAPDRSLAWSRRFEGVGPVVAIELERPIGRSGLAFIGSFRGALLFGNKDLYREVVNGIDEGLPIVSLHHAAEVLGIGEIQLGAEWTRTLPNGTDVLIRGTYEGQLWSDTGTPTLGYLGFEGFGAQVGFAR